MVRKTRQKKPIEIPAREATATGACRISSDFETEVDLASDGRDEEARRQQQAEKAMAVVETLCGIVRTSGRRFIREEMNER